MLSLVKRVALTNVRNGRLPHRYTSVRHHGYEGGQPGAVSIILYIFLQYAFIWSFLLQFLVFSTTRII